MGAPASRSFARTRIDAVTAPLSPLHGDLAERFEDEAVGQPACGLLADDDRPRVRRRLQPRGDVRRVAQRDDLRVGGADEPDRGRPAVDADPDCEARDSPRALDVVRIAADDLVDSKRGAGGALGIVLVSGGDAEVGADAVPLVGLHRAAVLLDGPAHHRHALADEHLDLVGRESFAEHRRADDVGEEDGHRAPLVFPRLGASRRRSQRGCADVSRATEGLVLAQDRLLERPELRARLQPELLGQQSPRDAVGLECVRLTAGSVQRQHQLCAQPLVQRMQCHQRL